MLILERAIKSDASKLAEIQKVSFDDESKHFNNNEICGPLGYDSVSWQEEMMHNCEYFKVLYNGEIIGGAIAMIFIESNQVHNLGRIFIDPNYQNQGLGKKVMKKIEGSFPDSTKWWLDGLILLSGVSKIITSIQSVDSSKSEKKMTYIFSRRLSSSISGVKMTISGYIADQVPSVEIQLPCICILLFHY